MQTSKVKNSFDNSLYTLNFQQALTFQSRFHVSEHFLISVLRKHFTRIYPYSATLQTLQHALSEDEVSQNDMNWPCFVLKFPKVNILVNICAKLPRAPSKTKKNKRNTLKPYQQVHFDCNVLCDGKWPAIPKAPNRKRLYRSDYTRVTRFEKVYKQYKKNIKYNETKCLFHSKHLQHYHTDSSWR